MLVGPVHWRVVPFVLRTAPGTAPVAEIAARFTPFGLTAHVDAETLELSDSSEYRDFVELDACPDRKDVSALIERKLINEVSENADALDLSEKSEESDVVECPERMEYPE